MDEDGNKLFVNIIKNKFECLEKNYIWINFKINFDDVLMLYLVLF